MPTSVSKSLPTRALVISVAAMAVPLLAGFVAPEWMTSREGVLVWLTALVPAFMLAYYKGWHGASVALALGMATLTSANVALLLVGGLPPNWTLLFGVVLVYIAVCLGLSTFADLRHRARLATPVSKSLPPRALVISVAAMAVPLLAGFVAPEWMTSREGVLVWLTALVPAFLLAYYKGWHGASVALALGMATLTSVNVALLLVGGLPPNWALLFGVVLVYIGVSLGLGTFAHLLHRARHEAERLIQRAVYGIFRSSPEGQFLMVNPAMVRILGYDSEEELLRLHSVKMVYTDPRAGMLQRFLVTEHVERFPVQWLRKDGEVASLLVSGHPVTDDSGEVVCLEFMVEDVTERRILEEQLHQAQRLDALGQLAGRSRPRLQQHPECHHHRGPARHKARG